MSTAVQKTLDDRLNERADAELEKFLEALIKPLREPQKGLGLFQQRDYVKPDGSVVSFWIQANRLKEALTVSYREDFREKFRSDFVAKVEAMQAQMENYIGALTQDQPQ